jgi:hypothetical protein
MATRGYIKIAKNYYFAMIFSIKIDFRVQQLLNSFRKSQRLLSVGYTLLYGRSGVILASHKSKTFLAMRGTAAPFKPKTEGGTFPFWQPPDVSFE